MPGAHVQQQSISRLVKVLFITHYAPQIRVLYVLFLHIFFLIVSIFFFKFHSEYVCLCCNISSCVNCFGYLSSCPWCLPRLFPVATSITLGEQAFLGSGAYDDDGRDIRNRREQRRFGAEGKQMDNVVSLYLTNSKCLSAASAFWSHLRLKCPSWFSDARENYLHGDWTSQECKLPRVLPQSVKAQTFSAYSHEMLW